MNDIAIRDAQVVWHPYTQMQSADLPIAVARGEGAYLYDMAGKGYLDAIASWWTNLHGHAHPHLAQAVSQQAYTLEHSIFAGFTHTPAVVLAERLLAKLPANQARVFYSDNGSTAVEVALKMAFQYGYNLDKPRRRVIAFENAYHGDTFGAMSVGARSAFSAPFSPYLFDVEFLPLPTHANFEHVKADLLTRLQSEDVAAFIFEPLVQGTAGMLMYLPTHLDALIKLCHEYGTITIADEVMTGFGRLGKLFACDYLQEKPTIMCFSKGLTGGFMPLGITTCAAYIYDAFLSNDRYKTFFHGHSYTGNPLACSVALASLDLVESPAFEADLQRINTSHEAFAARIANHPRVKEVRHLGTIVAVEIATETSSYFHNIRDKLYQFFINKQILLRPLGNIVYILPPYCITNADLERCYQAIEEALEIV